MVQSARMPTARSQISTRRLQALGEAALGQFCRQGYERCQMADVARAMGVAVGTIYLYVEGKEALFDFAVRYAGSEGESLAWLESLPVPLPAPPPGATLEFLQEGFGRRAEWPVLTAALTRDEPDDALSELRKILAEQYRLIRRHQRVLALLMHSALEFPGLSRVFVEGLRDRLLHLLASYLERRARAGLLRPVVSFQATAAVMIQAIVWAHLQRPVDPTLGAIDDETLENSTLDLLVHGMAPASLSPSLSKL